MGFLQPKAIRLGALIAPRTGQTVEPRVCVHTLCKTHTLHLTLQKYTNYKYKCYQRLAQEELSARIRPQNINDFQHGPYIRLRCSWWLQLHRRRTVNVYSASCPVTAGIGSSSPVTREAVKIMDGWIVFRSVYSAVTFGVEEKFLMPHIRDNGPLLV